jgi:hypothetical protein
MKMSLENLLRIGKLAEHTTDADQVARMMASAVRSIDDARQDSISPETRLDAAYRAIMQMAMVGLWANGYRPSKGVPGHHVTMIQSLPKSVDLDGDQTLVLDTFRIKRNAADYTGEDIDEASVEACIEAASALSRHVQQWLDKNRPDLSN